MLLNDLEHHKESEIDEKHLISVWNWDMPRIG